MPMGNSASTIGQRPGESRLTQQGRDSALLGLPGGQARRQGNLLAMKDTVEPAAQGRVLVLAPAAEDAALSRMIRKLAGLTCQVCYALSGLCQELGEGADAVLLAEEVLASDESECLLQALRRQPVWSDLPVLLLAAPGADSPIVGAALDLLGNVTILERPIRVMPLISALRAAVQARRRQYQVRDQMDILARTQEALRASDISLRRLMERLPAGAYTCDPDGLITSFNQRAVQLWGRAPKLNDPADRFCGSFKLFGTDGSPIAHDQCWMALALRLGDEYNGREIVIERPDGARFTVLAHASPIRDEFGKLLGAVNVVVDVTERKRTEQALRDSEERLRVTLTQSEQRFQTVFENALEPILLMNDSGRYVYGNPAACQLLGYSRDELMELTAWDITPAANREQVAELLASLLSMGAQSGDYTMLCKDGTTRDVEYRAVANILPGLHLGVHRDVTERKRAERAMQESHALLRAVIESVPQAIYVKDLQGRYLMMNSPGARFIGKEPPEVLGGDDAALFEPETVRRIKETDRQVLESGRSDTQEQTLTAAGVTRTYLTSKAPFRGAHGEVLGVLGISADITERKRAEEALRQSEERLGLAIHAAALGIFEHDHPMDAIYWSPMMRAILGWGAEESASLQGYFELVHPEDRARIVSSVRQAHAPKGNGMYGVEHRVVRPDGGIRWISVCSRTYFEGEFDARRPLRTVGIVADITEQKSAQEDLKRQKEWVSVRLAELERIYDYTPVGLCFVDRNLRYVHINEQLAAMNGSPAREHIGRTIREIIPDVADEVEQHFRRALESGEPILNVELHGVTAAEPGVARDWLENYFPLRSEAGTVIGVTAAVVEITSRKRAEQELRDYSERVHTLSRQLVAVQEEERRHLARELHDELGQVLATINFQLHAAKGLAGAAALPRLEECGKLLQQAGEQVRGLALELRPTMLDVLGLEATLRWLCERHQQRTGCGVQFNAALTGAPLSPELAIACFRVVQEALTNVVRHAVAHHVWIELSRSESVLEVIVRDDGVGFDVVTTREQTTRRRGLGLLGMAERVQLLGGTLQVESEPGRGTRIRASFPLREALEESTDPGE
jgi:PAS domain S-box-containing protein